MANYGVIYSSSAAIDINNLPEIKDQIEKKIKLILENPLIGKPLGGIHIGRRSKSVGPNRKYRIIYAVNDKTKTVEILKVGPREKDTPRRDVYKRR